MNDRGRTRITTRALTRVIAAVSAEALRVTADQVTIGLTDADGRLAVHVRAPMRIASLTAGRPAGDGQSAGQVAGGTVLHRAERAQERIRVEAARLTGSDVSRVTVQVSGAIVRREERVR